MVVMGLRKPPKVRKRTYPSGNTVYEVDFTLNGVRTREVFGTRKDLAEAYAAKVFMESQQASAGIKQKVVAPSLAVLVEDYLRTKVRRTEASTQRRYRIYAEHLTTFFADKMPRVQTIDQITFGQLNAFMDELINVEKQRNKTLNGQVQFIRSLFVYAVDAGYLAVSPAKRLESFPEREDETPPYWELDEVHKLLKQVGVYWRDACAFLFHTGLRKGELINLKWADIQLEQDIPYILVRRSKGWSGPKGKRFRVVPLTEDAVQIVKRQKKSEDHDHVFSDFQGKPIDKDAIYQAIKLACKQLGLEGDVHKWRHTFATHLVKQGVGIEKVSKLLGHASLKDTMKYAHVADIDMKLAVDLLPPVSSVIQAKKKPKKSTT